MNGYEVAAQIRTICSAPGPLLIALTGYGQEADLARSQSVGFNDHLIKPVDFDRLRELLANADLSFGIEV